MKLSGKMLTMFAALFLSVGMMMGTALSVSAAEKNPSGIKISSGNTTERTVKFNSSKRKDAIRRVKSGCKELFVKQAGTGYPIKSLTYGKSKLKKKEDLIVSAKAKGNVKVVMNKGYQLEKIEIGKYDQKGSITYTPIKNGASITLGKMPYKLAEEKYTNKGKTIRITYRDKDTQQKKELLFTVLQTRR